MATGSGERLPYVPANPPLGPPGSVELVRATWDEFYRLGQVLSQIDQPVSVIAEADAVLPVAAPGGAWNRLFDSGVVFPWEAPKGMLSPVSGEWRCRVSGIYHAAFALVVEAFGDPIMPKPYQLEVRSTHSSELPDVVKSRSVICSDGQSGEVSFTLIFMANQGDVMTFDARLSQAGGGVVNAETSLTLMRLSGAR